eukprot:4897216-Alexandrium_andersonii.AAC.1
MRTARPGVFREGPRHAAPPPRLPSPRAPAVLARASLAVAARGTFGACARARSVFVFRVLAGCLSVH